MKNETVNPEKIENVNQMFSLFIDNCSLIRGALLTLHNSGPDPNMDYSDNEKTEIHYGRYFQNMILPVIENNYNVLDGLFKEIIRNETSFQDYDAIHTGLSKVNALYVVLLQAARHGKPEGYDWGGYCLELDDVLAMINNLSEEPHGFLTQEKRGSVIAA